MKKIKAAVYARFSSSNQRFESIETQMDSIRKYCDSNNIDIIAEFKDEAKTATNDSRDGFLQMIDESKYGKWDVIVLYSLDRFARNASNFYYYKSILDGYGIRIISVIDGLSGEDTAESSLMESLKVGLAEYFSHHLSKLILDSCIMTSKKALKVGGLDNLGFTTINQKYEINEEEAKTIRLMFDLLIKGLSYQAIANHLNELGLKTKLGNDFGTSAVINILQNRKYNGYMVYNVYKRKRKLTDRELHKVLKDESEHIIIPNVLPKIIDDETFLSAQRIINRRRIYKIRDEESKTYLLSSLLFCEKCGGKYYHSTKTGRNKKKRDIYRCKNKQSGCKGKEINAKYLNDFIIQLLDEILLSGNKEELEAIIKKSLEDKIEAERIRLKVLKEDDNRDRIEIDRYSEIAQSTQGLAKEALMKEIRIRVENSLERQIAIKDLSNHLEKALDGVTINVDKVIERYSNCKNDEYYRLKEFVFNIIDKIIIGDNDILIDLDLSWFVDNYSSEITLRIPVNRDLLARNKMSDYRFYGKSYEEIRSNI